MSLISPNAVVEDNVWMCSDYISVVRSHIKHVISRKVCHLNDLHNRISVGHDIGDNYFTFQSFNARNLLSTDVGYNYPVYCIYIYFPHL